MLILAMRDFKPGEFDPYSRAYALLARMYGDTGTKASAQRLLPILEKRMPRNPTEEGIWFMKACRENIQKNTGVAPPPDSGF